MDLTHCPRCGYDLTREPGKLHGVLLRAHYSDAFNAGKSRPWLWQWRWALVRGRTEEAARKKAVEAFRKEFGQTTKGGVRPFDSVEAVRAVRADGAPEPLGGNYRLEYTHIYRWWRTGLNPAASEPSYQNVDRRTVRMYAHSAAEVVARYWHKHSDEDHVGLENIGEIEPADDGFNQWIQRIDAVVEEPPLPETEDVVFDGGSKRKTDEEPEWDWGPAAA